MQVLSYLPVHPQRGAPGGDVQRSRCVRGGRAHACIFACAVHGSLRAAVLPGSLTTRPLALPSFVTCAPQVVYPALDAKVKNVTIAYSHEHRDEVSAHCRGGERGAC